MRGNRKFILLFLRIIYVYCIISLLMFNVCICLYEDQVGLFDWRQQYIGTPKEIYFEQTVHSKKAFTSTEANVLAAINTRTGEIIWRKIFEKEEDSIVSLLCNDKYLITVSGKNEKIIRSWDKNKGILYWESSKSDSNAASSFENLKEVLAKYQAQLLSEDNGGILIIDNNLLTLHSQSDGSEIWAHPINEPSTSILGLIANEDNQNVIIICLQKVSANSAKILVKHLNIDSGKEVKSPGSFFAPWFNVGIKCEIIAAKFLVCLNKNTKSIYTINLLNFKEEIEIKTLSEQFDIDIDDESKLAIEKLSSNRDSELFVMRFKNDHCLLLQIKENGKLVILKELKNSEGMFFESYDNNNHYIFQITQAKSFYDINVFTKADVETSVSSLKSLCSIAGNDAPIIAGTTFMYSKKKSQSYRLVLIHGDSRINLVQHIGEKKSKILWSREEALSTINHVQMIELPPLASAFKLEMLHNEFAVQPNTGITTMFINRIKSQIQQLQAFAESLRNKQNQRDKNILEEEQENVLSRDQFDIVKMIVIITKSRKIFGINSQNGEIKWSKFIKDSHHESKMNVFEQRTTAHFPLPPQCMLVVQNQQTARKVPQTLIYTFNPLTGEGLDKPNVIENFGVLNVALLPHEDSSSLKIVAMVDADKNIHFYPKTQSVLNKIHDQLDSMYIYLVNKTTNTFNGCKIHRHRDEFSLYNVWSINIPEDQEIMSIQSKRSDEVVNSVGRVLGDLQVLFKYLNPNVILVLTEQGEGLKGSFFIYLIDAVTGHVLYHARHKGAGRPIEAIISEHWLVYLYFNSKGRRYEMSVVEFYEGYEEKNHTAFSSLDPVDHPMILSQGYLLPVSGVSALATTNTMRGITNKNILIGLDNGFVYSLPKNFLDPRRSFKHTQVLQEEGLPPYVPELPIFPQGYINYNQTVANIRGIHTAAAGLESTSLVFVYGLDIFYTRVTPSKMFDVLKEDFDYIFISGVLSILILASIVFSKLASMRTLSLSWQ